MFPGEAAEEYRDLVALFSSEGPLYGAAEMADLHETRLLAEALPLSLEQGFECSRRLRYRNTILLTIRFS